MNQVHSIVTCMVSNNSRGILYCNVCCVFCDYTYIKAKRADDARVPFYHYIYRFVIVCSVQYQTTVQYSNWAVSINSVH